jgi:hydroxyacylglutathione hydrolase
MRPNVEAFLDPDTETFSYVVYDRNGGRAAVIDPVLDFDPKAGRTSTAGAERLVRFVRDNDLTVDWVLETHAHADHLSAAPFVRDQVGGRIGIGEHIREVQKTFREVFNLEKTFLPDGSQFEKLFSEGERFTIGDLEGEVMHTPGHTPADMSWRIGDAVFVGDTLFAMGCGRLFEGTAQQMHDSLQRLMELPEDTSLYCGHEYTLANAQFARHAEPDNQTIARRAEEVAARLERGEITLPTTVALERATNPFVRVERWEDFARLRAAKDSFR